MMKLIITIGSQNSNNFKCLYFLKAYVESISIISLCENFNKYEIFYQYIISRFTL